MYPTGSPVAVAGVVPSLFLYRDADDDASTHTANPAMLLGLNPVARGLNSLGLIAMA
jgi:hypothetical protein